MQCILYLYYEGYSYINFQFFATSGENEILPNLICGSFFDDKMQKVESLKLLQKALSWDGCTLFEF